MCVARCYAGVMTSKTEYGRRGGLERAKRMSSTARREGASKAAKARWAGHVKGVKAATHVGEVRFGDMVLGSGPAYSI